MKQIKNYIMLLFLVPCFCMAQGSKPASTNTVGASDHYNHDSLEEVVAAAIPQMEYKDEMDILKTYFETIDQKVSNKEWAERMKADAIAGMFDNFCTSDEKEVYSFFMDNCLVDSLREKVKSHHEAMVKKYGHLFPGKPAPNLTFTDKNGKQLSLQSFKGQVLLVDIWGTWCAPCIAETPYLAALQKEYAGRKDVRIMSIACDKNAEKWKTYLANHPTTWHQYLVTEEGNQVLDKTYFCEGIPRFIIIDKQGDIVTADAIRPSEETFGEYFRKIVNS